MRTDTCRRAVRRPDSPRCGRCGRCRHGFTWQCEQGVKTGLGMGVVDGAFSEAVKLPASSLVEVKGLVDPRMKVAIEAVAYIGD